MIKDNRSKFFVFVPFCLLSQAYQAQGIVKYEWKSSIKPFVQLLLDPMGLSKYDTKDFNEHCEKLATTVAMEIENILSSNYKVIAILGIEQSPSCCVNYIYTNHGNEKRKGLFIEKLYEKVKDYNIPIVGINRRYINKSLNQLKNIIENIAEIDK